MNTQKYSKISSTSGYVGVIKHPIHGLIVPTDQTYCWTCDLIGGYCGHCSGAHWLEVVEVCTEDLRENVCP